MVALARVFAFIVLLVLAAVFGRMSQAAVPWKEDTAVILCTTETDAMLIAELWLSNKPMDEHGNRIEMPSCTRMPPYPVSHVSKKVIGWKQITADLQDHEGDWFYIASGLAPKSKNPIWIMVYRGIGWGKVNEVHGKSSQFSGGVTQKFVTYYCRSENAITVVVALVNAGDMQKAGKLRRFQVEYGHCVMSTIPVRIFGAATERVMKFPNGEMSQVWTGKLAGGGEVWFFVDMPGKEA